jgi:hypothetical protein
MVLLLLVAALLVSGTAAAAWSLTNGAGLGGFAKARLMPTGPTAVASIAGGAGQNVALAWPAVTVGGAAVDGYTVKRYVQGGAVQVTGAACSGLVNAVTCTENAVPAGHWEYTLIANKGNWLGAEGAKSVAIHVVAAPTSVACSTCGGVGSAYINIANQTSISVQVVLPATSEATDTVHVTLTDTAAHTVSGTVAASAGAGTVTVVPALNTTTFVDGTVTISAYSQAATLEMSSSVSATVTRDIVAPTAADIQAANGGATAGRVQNADIVTYSWSEPINPASILAAWTGVSTIVTLRVSSAANSAMTVTAGVTGTPFGTVATGANYTGTTRTFTGSAMVMSGNSITITLATGTAGSTTVASSTMVWTPSATPTDLAGNPATTTARTETAAPKKNF